MLELCVYRWMDYTENELMMFDVWQQLDDVEESFQFNRTWAEKTGAKLAQQKFAFQKQKKNIKNKNKYSRKEKKLA